MDEAATFREAVPAVQTATAVETDGEIHVYTGRLAEREGEVRFIATAPEADPATREQFGRRVEQWEACSGQPTVVDVHARGQSPRPWIAVDIVEGHRLPEARTEMTEAELFDVLADVADALHYAARNDIEQPVLSPENIVVSLAGTPSGQVEWNLPDTTPEVTLYTPPEARENPATHRTVQASIYRLGAIAAAGLTGSLQAPDTSEKTADKTGNAERQAEENERVDGLEQTDWPVSAEQKVVLNRALAADPAKRYDSLYEFKRALLFDVPTVEETGEQTTAETEGVPITRRGVLGILGAGILGVSGLFATPRLRETTSTPPAVRSLDGVGLFRYDTANTGVWLDGSGPTRGLRLLWRFETDGAIASSAAVVDTSTADEESSEEPQPTRVFVGSNDGNVYALDAADGTEHWAVETGGAVISSPAVVAVPSDESEAPEKATVFVGSDDGNVYALDAADGTEHWAVETGGPVRSSPTVTGETVYVGSTEGAVYALDVSDGSERWTVQTEGEVTGTPAVASRSGREDAVVIGDVAGTVHALGAETGEHQWQFHADGPVRSAPAVRDGTVCIGTMNGSLYAIGTGDGAERWRFESRDRIRSSPAVTTDTVYVGSDDGTVHALERESGVERWAFDTGSTVSGSPVVTGTTTNTADDATVYVRTHDGTLYTIDSATGDGRVYFHTSGPQATRPAVHDGAVYVGISEYNSDSVTALDAADGTERWTVPLAEPLRDAPVVTDDVVISVTEAAYRERTVRAYGVVDGVERWSFDVSETRNVSITATDGVACVGVRTELDGGILFGLDASTGVRRWRFGEDGLAMVPVARDGTLYVVTESNELEALDPTGGQVRWSRATDFTVGFRPEIGEEIVVMSEDDGETVRAVDVGDGDERWTTTIDGEIANSPVIESGLVYVSTGFENGTSTLVALDAADGRHVWTADISGRLARGPFGASDSLSLVATGSNTDTLYALDSVDGTVRWDVDLSGRVRTPLTGSHGTIYAGSDDGTITAFDAGSGTERWSFDTGHPVRRELAVSGGTVYVGSVDDLVYALDAETGSVEWGYKNREPTPLSPTVLQDSLYIGSASGHMHRLFDG